MSDYKRLVKDCFWDLNISEDEIDHILNGNDLRQKNFLFDKILLNSTKLFYDLNQFKHSDLQILLENYSAPTFNEEYALRRKNMAEVYFFDKSLLIENES